MSELAVRDANLNDVLALDALLQAAYTTRRSFASGLRNSLIQRSARTFVIDVDDRPVGIASLHDYGICGYVAQVGVDPAYRRRGIARRITSALVDAASARGYAWLELDATPMAEPLYKELGFVSYGDTIVYEGPSFGAEIDRAIWRAQPDDLIEICDFDWSAFGADRTATIRALSADPAVKVFVMRTGGVVTGYAAAREDRVAPWIASTYDDALRLLDAARAALSPRTVAIYVPSDATAPRAALELRGFMESARLAHMVRGRRSAARREWIYGRVSLGEG
jgi:GNAT superfamily N-acetyltransferase